MDSARSSSFIAITLSSIAIMSTLAYIPYMLTQIDAVMNTLKVHNDEFEVVENAVRMEFRIIRDNGATIRSLRQNAKQEVCARVVRKECPDLLDEMANQVQSKGHLLKKLTATT
ncbi:unnamed protein product [Nippostrongylus brasiliensis]|uniref:Col_cuticle_N domain-containing protein n=1 Tax=Nippostrongylus brasiliensis TaxID=27835 RepID=A0A0N4Y9K2_NIPBR|nr:unnamed protein product [Nippostrongylus brasiliensis]